MYPAQVESFAQKEAFLLDRALKALQETTGLPGNVIFTEPETGNGNQVDAVIELEILGLPRQYLVEIKLVDRFAAIGQIKSQFDQLGQAALLVANYITAEMADKCRALDVQFIDTQGNAFLHGPGWLVLVKGQRQSVKAKTGLASRDVSRAATAAALRIIFALISQPELLCASYRDIKQAAGVALGTIGGVFLDLNNRGLVIGGQKSGERRMLERQRLIQEWVTNYPLKLRPKLNARRFHADNPDWWKTLDVTRYEACWGGEVAADKLTAHLKPSTFTLYMQPQRLRQNLTKLVVDCQLRADPGGEIEVLETFWHFEPEGAADIVPPLLVYADLLASMDPRNIHVAQIVLEQINGLESKG